MKWRERNPFLSNELSRLKDLEPHELLNVEPGASVEQIKKAYRELVKVYHPDKSSAFMRGHNKEVMKLINQAYDHLMAGKEDPS
jgi:curved DNA-binding protein CbpA